jgi:tRNA dimethylallyltransferase
MDARPGTTPLIVVVGETASGKSDLAMQLARQFNGELICADAWTVRKGVDVGTAKPSKEDQQVVPHHLLDVVGPEQEFTAAVFKELATRAIDDISARGKLPIMVGGTGLYVDSVLYNYSFLPAGDRQARKALDILSMGELQDRVASAGLDTTGIDTQNRRRLIRLLETNGMRGERSPMRAHTLVLGVHVDRESLEERMTQRVDAMLAAGLEKEVKNLANRYGWDCEALKGIGYREWHEYFDGAQTLDQTRERIIRATRALAKKQRTWFRRNNSIHWTHNRGEAVAIATTFLSK